MSVDLPSPSAPFRHVPKQLEKIVTLLKGNTEEWRPRFSALVELERVVTDLSIYSDFSQHFNDHTLAPLTQPLQSQILDLRSEVVRQACSTISVMARLVSHHWSRGAAKLIPTLCTTAAAANIVIRGYSHQCLEQVVAHVHQHHAALTLLQECKSAKSEGGRTTGMEMVRLMILLWPPKTYRKHATLLEEAIVTGLKGASVPTRTAAAGCYWGYADSPDSGCSSAAQRLHATLDPRVKKVLATQQQQAQQHNQHIKLTHQQSTPTTLSSCLAKDGHAFRARGRAASTCNFLACFPSISCIKL